MSCVPTWLALGKDTGQTFKYNSRSHVLHVSQKWQDSSPFVFMKHK